MQARLLLTNALAATGIGLALLSAACTQQPAADAKAAPAKAGEMKSAGTQAAAAPAGNPGYSDLLADVDKRIAAMQKMVDKDSGDWLSREHLAGLIQERVGLTNDFSDYLRIQKLLDECFAIAPKGSGPNLMAAHFDYSIHRIYKMEPYLAQYEKKVLFSAEDLGQVDLARADVAYHSSDYPKALRLYREAVRLTPNLQSISRLSDYYWRTDGWTEGMALLRLAERDYLQPEQHQLHAWLDVQMGSMYLEDGRYADALLQYQLADKEVPHWWMVDEHIAKVYDFQGKTDEAIALYEECIRQSGHPDEMDELASLYQKKGEKDKAAAMIQQAQSEWESRLTQLPEAALGHMINHELKFETDMKKLCDIAERNFKARPTGLAYVKLAQAYFKAGRTADAQRIVDQCLATAYRNPAIYGIASKVYAKEGNAKLGEQYRLLCLQMNPRYPGMEAKPAPLPDWLKKEPGQKVAEQPSAGAAGNGGADVTVESPGGA